ncbi:uncharacterized protein N7515_004585 [Penicillium bovifimosum]|uniref:Protein kinase domain-containing protein n=1 Tax=Penicillium bovifimosum TaxID=126998 RepID=A0A9W9H0E7_9EURO|nr:uncharacterized protein N7515_004585 [Penicillium bovifimosum]KAJ5135307.1 hypothetical protein N7515_004585 [Penicillium bovifimosum]
MKFGDYQALPPHDAEKVPDVVMLSLLDSTALLVGELETFWTLLLENHPIRRGFPVLIPLQPHLGQLISYMRSSNLRFGFLSTYRSTVFVRRVATFRFEMSMPISEKSTNPSIRRCVAAMALFASQDPTFIEPPDFIAEQLSISADVFCQASTRPSPFGNQIAAKQNTPDEDIGSQSILFGADNRIATTLGNCKRLIHGSKHKAVYEVTWDGQPAIAKCWSPSYYQSYAHEAMTYENIYAKRPQGYRFFAMMLSHGTISCSSLFPKGNILIMTKVPGKTLNELWDTISGLEKEHIRSEVFKAVRILRSFSVLSVDTGKHNILYHPETRSVTMIDFEIMQACEDTLSPDMPEMYTIFGEMPVPTLT